MPEKINPAKPIAKEKVDLNAVDHFGVREESMMADPQDSRTIRLDVRTTWHTTSWPSIIFSIKSIAVRAIPLAGVDCVVSAGVTKADTSESPQPTTATSCGTRIPDSPRPRYTPMAV